MVLFTAGWWWRATWIQDYQLPHDERLYFIHFGFMAFVALAIVAWFLGDLHGLTELFDSGSILWIIPFLQLAVWGRISYGADVRNAEIAFSSAVQLITVSAFTLTVAANAPSARATAFTLTASMVLLVFVGIAQSAVQHDLKLHVLFDPLGLDIRELTLDPARSGISVVETVDGTRYLRPYSLTAHPNLTAGLVAMGLAAASGLWMNQNRRWAAFALGIGWWGLLLSFSRSALVAFFIGGVFFAGMYLIYLYRNSTRDEDSATNDSRTGFTSIQPIFQTLKSIIRRDVLPLIMLFVVVGMIFAALYYPLIAVRYGIQKPDTPTLETLSSASRAVYIEEAGQLIRENPLKGVGIGNMPWESAWMLRNDPRDLRGDNVHNIYLLSLSEVGIVGFGLYIGAIGIAFLLFLRRTWQGKTSVVQISLMTGVMIWLAIGWYEHYPWSQFGYQLIFWGVLAIALHHNEL